MGILDDAIREHLDLKRQHGAREDELQHIEDDAFGSGERPDSFSEGVLGGAAAPGASEQDDPTMLVEAPEGPQPLDPSARPDVPPPAAPEAAAPAAPPAAPPGPPGDLAQPEAPADTGEGPGDLFDFETAENEGTLDSAPPPADAPASPAEPAFPGGAPEAPPPPAAAAPPEAPAAPPVSQEPPPGVESPVPPPAEPPEPAAPPEPAPPPPAEPTPPEPSPEPPADSESLADLMAEEEPEAAAPEPPAPPPPAAPETEVRPIEPAAEPEAEALPEPAPEPEMPVQPELAPESEELEAMEPESLEEDVVEAPEPPESVGGPDPPPPPPEPGTEPKGRARGRVHHPTEEHPAPDPGSTEFEYEEDLGPPSSEPLEPAGSSSEGSIGEEPSAVFDFESDAGEADMPIGSDTDATPDPEEIEAGVVPAAEAAPEPASDEFEDLGPTTDERPYEEGESDDQPAVDVRPADTDEEDLLAASPDFIDEEAEEDEDLWFEKGPPKDFDFEDEK